MPSIFAAGVFRRDQAINRLASAIRAFPGVEARHLDTTRAAARSSQSTSSRWDSEARLPPPTLRALRS